WRCSMVGWRCLRLLTVANAVDLAGIPVLSLSREDQVAAPSRAWPRSTLFTSSTYRGAIRRSATRGSGPHTGIVLFLSEPRPQETWAANVDIVHLVSGESPARWHRRLGELYDRPGPGANQAGHPSAGGHGRPGR